jgi:hypothetical protein
LFGAMALVFLFLKL